MLWFLQMCGGALLATYLIWWHKKLVKIAIFEIAGILIVIVHSYICVHSFYDQTFKIVFVLII